MSDEIIDVTSEHIQNLPEEIKTKDGMNIPDSSIVENISEEGMKEIENRRSEVSNLPPYPEEWQKEYSEDITGFDTSVKLPVNATIKEDEIKKLIKKYKRYMKSNLKEIRRVDKE